MIQSHEPLVSTRKDVDETAEIEDVIHFFNRERSSLESAEVADSSTLLPRVGDGYQAFVQPFNRALRPDIGCGPTKIGFNQEDEQVIETAQVMEFENRECFAHGLAVPVMKISRPLSWPFVQDTDNCCNESRSLDMVDHLGNGRNAQVRQPYNMQLINQDSSASGLLHTGDRWLPESVGSGPVIEGPSEYQRNFQGGSENSGVLELDIDSIKDNRARGLGMQDSQKCQKKKKGKNSWTKSKKRKVQTLNTAKSRRVLSASASLFAQLADRNEAASSSNFAIVPGSPMVSWSESEAASFIVGIYFMGKDFTALTQFLETKRMVDIIGFYYGKFYGTYFYNRWADSKKSRSRRCIYGERLLSGWRQQELLKRILPYMNETSQKGFLEVVSTYNDGGISSKEFVTQLKAAVGLGVLVHAVGLGAGKLDLTAVHVDPGRSNYPSTSCADICLGKACSSLSNEEIIQVLNGNFRISKARAHDLFWEAVWPRLLARGWHSEQVGDQGLFKPQSSLVFLIPGVRRFKRGALAKGSHYFDSVSEVLNLIATNPTLIEPPHYNSDYKAGLIEDVWSDEDSKSSGSSDGSLNSLKETAEEIGGTEDTKCPFSCSLEVTS